MDGQNELLSKLKVVDCVSVAAGLLGTLCALVQNEIFFNETDTHRRYSSDKLSSTLSILQSLFTIILCKASLTKSSVIAIARHYQLYYHFVKEKRRILSQSKQSPNYMQSASGSRSSRGSWPSSS